MNLKTVLFLVGGALIMCLPVRSQTDDSAKAGKSEKSSVTTLNGTKFFGIVEVTDDYTIRVSNDSGITRLPIAQLGDTDFQKYGLNKDRSNDGRLWYERKEALESSQEESQPSEEGNANEANSSEANSNENSVIEIRLGEIAAFQPVIAAYEKTLGSKKGDKAAADSKNGDKTAEGSKNPEEKPTDSETPFTPMFSQPGMTGPLPAPFTGFGSSALQPVSGAASSATGVIQSATGAANLPSAPR